MRYVSYTVRRTVPKICQKRNNNKNTTETESSPESTGFLSIHLSSFLVRRANGSSERPPRFLPRAVGREPCERR